MYKRWPVFVTGLIWNSPPRTFFSMSVRTNQLVQSENLPLQHQHINWKERVCQKEYYLLKLANFTFLRVFQAILCNFLWHLLSLLLDHLARYVVQRAGHKQHKSTNKPKNILLITSVPSFSWHCANFCLLLIFTRLDTIRIPKKIRLTFSVKSKDQLDYPILWSTKGWWSSQWGLHSKTESASDLRAHSSPPLRGCGFPDRLVGHAKISLIYVFVWLKDSNKGPF